MFLRSTSFLFGLGRRALSNAARPAAVEVLQRLPRAADERAVPTPPPSSRSTATQHAHSGEPLASCWEQAGPLANGDSVSTALGGLSVSSFLALYGTNPLLTLSHITPSTLTINALRCENAELAAELEHNRDERQIAYTFIERQRDELRGARDMIQSQRIAICALQQRLRDTIVTNGARNAANPVGARRPAGVASLTTVAQAPHGTVFQRGIA